MNYLKIYKQLVQKRKKLPADLFFDYTQNHHIIPRSYKSELSNNYNNMVILSAREHFIAHALLVKIAKQQNNKPLYYKMLCAFDAMSKLYGSVQHPQYRQKTKCISKLYQIWKKELSQYKSQHLSGQNSPNWNTMLIYNQQTRQIKKINKNQQLPQGWCKGTPPQSIKRGEETNTYGTRWIYNTVTLQQKLLKRDQQLEEGWVFGMSPNSINKNMIHPNPSKGKIWITNIQTFECKLISKNDQIPEGWLRGKLLKGSINNDIEDIDYSFKSYTKEQWKELSDSKKCQIANQYKIFYSKYGWNTFKQKYNYLYDRTALKGLIKRYEKGLKQIRIYNKEIAEQYYMYFINNGWSSFKTKYKFTKTRQALLRIAKRYVPELYEKYSKKE